MQEQPADGIKAVQIRFRESLLAELEDWRRAQRPRIPSRQAAICALIRKSLADDDSAASRKGMKP